jgi:hypothetical protein
MNTTTQAIPQYKQLAAQRAIVKAMAEEIFSNVDAEKIQAAVKIMAEKHTAMMEAKYDYDYTLRDCAVEMLRKK